MLELVRREYYEILKILKDKENGVQSSRLVEIVKSVSQSTAYRKIEELEEAGLIDSKWIFEDKRKKPRKYYIITPLGKNVLEKVEEIHRLLRKS
jgi:DNA-binding PadR family transcriptional regulator